MTTETIRWGILGPGIISTKFANGLQSVPDAKITAVGSRDKERAETFAQEFKVPRAYGSYEEMAADPDVDVVYIGTPHSFHKEHTILCLDAGKHVLCEKPFAINAVEAREMIQAALRNNRFLMEAMWTRFLPAIVKTRELIKAGAIGDVRMIQADFGYRTEVDATSRLFDLALGGGALLDVGIYPLSLAHMILGTPDHITSMASFGTTGVDEQTAFILGYDRGAMAVLSAAIRTTTQQEAFIMGTKGYIKIHAPWWVPDTLTLKAGFGEGDLSIPYSGNGYNYQAEEVGRCIRENLPESMTLRLSESLTIMRIMDHIRDQIDLKYPME